MMHARCSANLATAFDQSRRIISEIRKRHLPFDVIAPDAHFGYYQAKTIEIRLKVAVPEIQTRQP
jgi:hypothetical protein